MRILLQSYWRRSVIKLLGTRDARCFLSCRWLYPFEKYTEQHWRLPLLGSGRGDHWLDPESKVLWSPSSKGKPNDGIQSNPVDNKRVIGHESTPKAEATLVSNTSSEYVIKQWRTDDGANFWKAFIMHEFGVCLLCPFFGGNSFASNRLN